MGNNYNSPQATSTQYSQPSNSLPTNNQYSSPTVSNPFTQAASNQQYSSPTNNQYSAPQAAPSSQYSNPVLSTSSSQNSYSVPVSQTNYQRRPTLRRQDDIPLSLELAALNQKNRQPVATKHINPRVPQNRRRTRLPIPQKPTLENQRSGGQYAPALPHLPRPLPLTQDKPQSFLPPPPPPLPHARRPPPHHRHPVKPLKPQLPNRRIEDVDAGDESEEEGGLANFLGLKLPELPELPKLSLPELPNFFGGDKAEEKKDEDEKKTVKIKEVDGVKVKSEVYHVPLGKRPPKDALKTKV